ncbi:MAG: hypothetical protein U5S82_21150 [Gammaproteobacteria bacterium]|nr:hypothetical protein [Gammaproteobacteria bacterium]
MESTLTLAAGALTRLVALGIGAFLCYLGFRLFSEVPVPAEGEAELSGVRGMTIKLTRVGPGVFFALFGTVVVVWSLSRPLEYAETRLAAAGDVLERRAGAMNPPAGGQGHEDAGSRRNVVAQEVQWLNQVALGLSGRPDSELVHDPEYMVPRIKQVLMESVWDETVWGSPTAFRQWLERTGGLTPPADPATAQAAAFYQALPEGDH